MSFLRRSEGTTDSEVPEGKLNITAEVCNEVFQGSEGEQLRLDASHPQLFIYQYGLMGRMLLVGGGTGSSPVADSRT